MGQPWGIAFGKDGLWAAADRSGNCVYLFDSQDQLIKTLTSGSDEWDRPTGISFDSNNHLYIVNYGRHRIEKFDISGKFLLKFGKCGSHNAELCCPRGIAIYNDEVYIAEQLNYRVSVFRCNGQFRRTIGSGLLNESYDVAITYSQRLLVAEDGISIFNLDGSNMAKIITRVQYPHGIATDLYGSIFTTSVSDIVVIFDKDGTFLHHFGSKGSSAGQFSCPRGIACSPNGSVYVSDDKNKRIQIFSIVD